MIVDSHAHGTHLVPGPIKAVHRMRHPKQPRDVSLSALRPSGVDAIVVTAVGDELVTQFHRPSSAWDAVLKQLRMIRREATAGGCELALTAADIASAGENGRTAVVLGLEGADTLADDLGRLDVLHDLGVRVVGIMHYADSPFGTICMNFTGGSAGAEVEAGRVRGLTGLGGQLVDELGAKGMLIDVAHSDEETIAGICERTSRPVISSHTGAKALDDFPRYLSDRSITAIAATGGVIGLWPYRGDGHGMETFDDFGRHASHIAELVGPEHLCLGTDMNGVPSLIHGYEGPQHIPNLIEALERIGFTSTDIDGIMGGNVLRML